MPNFLNLVRSRSPRNIPTIATNCTASIRVTSDPITRQLVVQDHAVPPEVGMYSVLLLNGAQILVKYAQILPYTLNGTDTTDTSYTYVRPKPDVFEVKKGRYFTLLVGEMHVVALIMQILSHSSINPAPTTSETDGEYVPHAVPSPQSASSSIIPPPDATHNHERTISPTAPLQTKPFEPKTSTRTSPRLDAYPTPESARPSPLSPGILRRSSRRTSSSFRTSIVETEAPVRAQQEDTARLITPDSLVSVPRQDERSRKSSRDITPADRREKELPELPRISIRDSKRRPVQKLVPTAPVSRAQPKRDQTTMMPGTPVSPVSAAQPKTTMMPGTPVSPFKERSELRDQHIAPVPPVPTVRPDSSAQRVLIPYTSHIPSPLKELLSFPDSPLQAHESAPATGILHSAEKRRLSDISPTGSPASRIRELPIAVRSTRTPNPKPDYKKHATKRVRLDEEQNTYRRPEAENLRSAETLWDEEWGTSSLPATHGTTSGKGQVRSAPGSSSRTIPSAIPHGSPPVDPRAACSPMSFEYDEFSQHSEAKIQTAHLHSAECPEKAQMLTLSERNKPGPEVHHTKWKGKERAISIESPPIIQDRVSNEAISFDTYEIVRHPGENKDLQSSSHRGRHSPTERYELDDILSPRYSPPSAHKHGTGPPGDFIPREGPLSEAPGRHSSGPLPPPDGSPLSRLRALDSTYTPTPIGAEQRRTLSPKEPIIPPTKPKLPLTMLPTAPHASVKMSHDEHPYSDYARDPTSGPSHFRAGEAIYGPPDMTGYARTSGLGAALGLTFTESYISPAPAVDFDPTAPPAAVFSVEDGPTVYLLVHGYDRSERDELLKNAILVALRDRLGEIHERRVGGRR